MITAIASMTEDHIIGCSGRIPWVIQQDLARYRMLTTDETVVMGRKTYDYLKMERPELLNNHTNVVLSRSRIPAETHIHWAATPREVLENYDRFFVIGGGQVFNIFLPYVTKIFMSLVHGKFKGDTFFPDFEHHFELRSREYGNDHDFIVYCRERF